MPELQIACLSTIPTDPAGIDTIKFLFPDHQITVRNLIAMAVREQCRQLAQRYRASESRTRLARQYLSEQEIGQLASTGRVALNDEAERRAPLNVENEIAKALEGFRCKSFMIMVGPHRCASLDELVTVALSQPVQFIRMIPLAGG